MCELFGSVDSARPKAKGDVLAMRLAHWKERAGRAAAHNVAMFRV